jgi:hypothetical protein
MYRLAQIYEEAKYDVHDLLRLHKIVKDLGMKKQDIINVLDLVKNDYDQLDTLQSKAENLRDDIKMWEIEKTRLSTDAFKVNVIWHDLEFYKRKQRSWYFNTRSEYYHLCRPDTKGRHKCHQPICKDIGQPICKFLE